MSVRDASIDYDRHAPACTLGPRTDPQNPSGLADRTSARSKPERCLISYYLFEPDPIAAVMCVIDREAGGTENIAAEALQLRSLFAMSELTDAAATRGAC